MIKKMFGKIMARVIVVVLIVAVLAGIWSIVSAIAGIDGSDVDALLQHYAYPVYLIRKLAKKEKAQNDPTYQTGITEDGLFRYTYPDNWNVHQIVYAAGEDNVIKLSDAYVRDYKRIYDFAPVSDGEADVIVEKNPDPDTGKDVFLIYHVTVEGNKAVSAPYRNVSIYELEDFLGEPAKSREHFPYSVNEEQLGYLRAALETAGLADRINPPITEEQAAKWETENSIGLPSELKWFLLFSNGFSCGSLEIYPLEKITMERDPKTKLRNFYFGTADNGKKPLYVRINDNYGADYTPNLEYGEPSRTFYLGNYISMTLMPEIKGTAHKENNADEKDS